MWFTVCEFLGASTQLRKATISLVMLYPSVRLSVRMEQLRYQWMDFNETLYFSFFGKSVKKIKSFIKIQQK